MRHSELREVILSVLLGFGIVIALFGFLKDYRNTLKYGGVDLRDRVVGARVFKAGLDPFFYKWKEGDSPLFLCLSDQRQWPVNLTTEPPTMVALLSFVADLPYKFLRISWLVGQWILLLLVVSIFLLQAKSKTKVKVILIIGLLFIAGDDFWRFHVERGQFKIIYVFIVSAAYFLTQMKFKHGLILGGFLIGLAASLRLPVVFMLLPMMIFRKWKIFFSAVIGLIVGASFPLFLTDVPIWAQFFSAMKIHAGIWLGFISVEWGSYPNVSIEGMSNLSDAAEIRTIDDSFQALMHTLGVKITPDMLLVAMCGTLLFISLFYMKYRKKNISNEMLFLLGILLVFISGFFIPAPRWSYCNIIWIVPLSLIVLQSDSPRFIYGPLICLVFYSLFSFVFPLGKMGLYVGNFTVLFYTGYATIMLLKEEQKKTFAKRSGN